jgi:hypothetical protein
MLYKCVICEEKINFNNYWAFCFDCRSFCCQKCIDEYIQSEVIDEGLTAYDPFYKDQFCVECDKKYFLDEETDLQRIKSNIDDSNMHNKHVLHFYNAVFKLNGFGCNIDHSEAFNELFISVMTKSFVPAMQTLGVMYGNGTGTEEDFDQAHKYFLRCAMQGYAPSIYCVGTDFLKGLAVEKDKDEAMFYIEVAAKKGYKPAFNHLSFMYRQNFKFKEARFWTHKHDLETKKEEPRPGFSDVFIRGKNNVFSDEGLMFIRGGDEKVVVVD